MSLFKYPDDEVWTGMDRMTDSVWLGDSGAARDGKTLAEHGITYTLNVAFDLDYTTTVPVWKVGLIDGPGNEYSDFERAVKALDQLVSEGHKVLVHCHAGVSRSPTIVATHLAWKNGWSFQKAIEFVGERRGIINPKLALVQLARTFLKEI